MRAEGKKVRAAAHRFGATFCLRAEHPSRAARRLTPWENRLRICVARSAEEMDRFRETWDRLFAECPAATLFQSFAWNRLAAAWFSEREAPFVVLAESDSGIALIPAAVTQAGVTLLGETLFDYRDVLWTGAEEVLWAAWKRVAELRLPLSIVAVRDASEPGPWFPFEPAEFARAPQVPRAAMTPEAFAAHHSRLGRRLRQLAKQGAALRRYDGDARDLIAWLYREKSIQLAEHRDNLFRDPRRREFMVAACALEPASCELFTLEDSGLPIAALLTFRDRRVRRFYTVWFDSRWARLSPGICLIYATTIDALQAGLDCDYMTGEQPHKMRFAVSFATLYRLHIDAGRLASLALGELARAA